MMPRLVLVWLLWATWSGQIVALAAGQSPAATVGQQDGDLLEIIPPRVGFPVRDIKEIGTLEQLKILARRALAPRAAPHVAPLQAYDPMLVCTNDGSLLTHASLMNTRYGPAALVAEVESGDYVAFYYVTPHEALRTAIEGNWCTAAAVQWYFATTYPIRNYHEPTRRFMSMDADRIATYLREDARAAAGSRPAP